MVPHVCKGCKKPLSYSGRGRRPEWCPDCKKYRKPSVVIQLPTAYNADATEAERDLTVAGTTLAKLREHGRVDSPHGQSALVLARALDAGRGGGVGIAAVAKAHAEALEAACAGAAGEPDVVDALMGRLG